MGKEKPTREGASQVKGETPVHLHDLPGLAPIGYFCSPGLRYIPSGAGEFDSLLTQFPGLEPLTTRGE